MGNIKHSNALFTQCPHNRKENIRFFRRQGRCGFIQYQKLCIQGKCLGDLYLLLLGYVDVPDQGPGIQMFQPYLRQHLSAVLVQLFSVYQSCFISGESS